MTTKPQPDALRLADALLEPFVLDKHAMQAADELLRLHAECEVLRADAERWRCFRTFVAGKSTRGFLNGKPAAYMVLPAITVERVGMTLDESIDAARAAKEQSK